MENDKKQEKQDNNGDLWLLIGKIHHKRVLVRQRELSPYNIPTRQLHILRIIRDMGENATLSEIAKKVERQVDVISRQAAGMEKDGLLKRIRVSPKSRQLRLELTEKGLKMANISGKSKAMTEIMSVLSEQERLQMQSSLNKILNKLAEYDDE
jgi:DNA-binding MarR family transcriptional regulator